jgi:hypothetical protein
MKLSGFIGSSCTAAVFVMALASTQQEESGDFDEAVGDAHIAHAARAMKP